MANKFLPFVVKSSTPLYIYQMLVQRSKGMNNILVASILYLVVDKGIEEVRKVSDALPELPLDKMYEELLRSYSQYMISNELFQKIQGIKELVKEHSWREISDELKEYELTDIMSFLLVMTLTKKLEEYTQLPLEKLFNGESEEAEQNLISAKLFSSDGEPYVFRSKTQLAGYIHFYCLLFEHNNPPVKAVLNTWDRAAKKRKRENPTEGDEDEWEDEH